MVAKAEVKAELVKIRALSPVMLASGVTLEPGQTAEVTKAEAALLTKSSEGPYAFRGERLPGEPMPRLNLRRAELVAAA